MRSATGGLAVVLSPAASIFGSIGRTISHRDQNSMTLTANFGVAFFLGRHQ